MLIGFYRLGRWSEGNWVGQPENLRINHCLPHHMMQDLSTAPFTAMKTKGEPSVAMI